METDYYTEYEMAHLGHINSGNGSLIERIRTLYFQNRDVLLNAGFNDFFSVPQGSFFTKYGSAVVLFYDNKIRIEGFNSDDKLNAKKVLEELLRGPSEAISLRPIEAMAA